MKKIILVVLFSIAFLNGLYSAPEYLFGVGFSSGKEIVSDGLRKSLHLNDQIINGEIYNSGDVRLLNFIGPTYEISVFPYSDFKLGLYIAGATHFVIGIDGDVYYSYNTDIMQNVRIGISYNQYFGSDTGLYMDIAFDYSWYRIAGRNEHNSKDIPIYSKYEEKNVYCDFGCIINNNNKNWFKVGFSFNKPILNDFNDGWGLMFTSSGGFIF